MTRKKATRLRRRENRWRRWAAQAAGSRSLRFCREWKWAANGREISTRITRHFYGELLRRHIVAAHLSTAAERFAELGGALVHASDAVDSMTQAMRTLEEPVHAPFVVML